ncbi:CU044_2847 family protein [Actinomadura kijaniata]
MPYFLEIPLRDGQTMLVEMTDQDDGLAPVGRGRDVIERLPDSFSGALDRVQMFTEEILERMRQHRRRPDRVAVEFGLKFSAKSGLVIAEAAGEAHLKLIAEWSHQPPGPPIDDEGDGGRDSGDPTGGAGGGDGAER